VRRFNGLTHLGAGLALEDEEVDSSTSSPSSTSGSRLSRDGPACDIAKSRQSRWSDSERYPQGRWV
jgi:hypothetical protein